MKVERLDGEDWERSKNIRLRALRDAPDAFSATFAVESQFPEEKWRERLSNSETATFVAVDGGDDVGAVVGGPYDDAAGLFAMWVAPAARHQGIAMVLIENVIQWAREKGCSRMRLDVGEHNGPARRLYERMGFVPTGMVSTLPPPREHVREVQLELALGG